MTAHRHRISNAAPGGRQCCLARRRPVCVGTVQHRLRVGADPLVDRPESVGLGTAGVLDRSTDHPAGVGDDVGEDQHPTLVQTSLGLRGGGQVGALRDDLGRLSTAIEQERLSSFALNRQLTDNFDDAGTRSEMAMLELLNTLTWAFG